MKRNHQKRNTFAVLWWWRLVVENKKKKRKKINFFEIRNRLKPKSGLVSLQRGFFLRETFYFPYKWEAINGGNKCLRIHTFFTADDINCFIKNENKFSSSFSLAFFSKVVARPFCAKSIAAIAPLFNWDFTRDRTLTFKIVILAREKIK